MSNGININGGSTAIAGFNPIVAVPFRSAELFIAGMVNGLL